MQFKTDTSPFFFSTSNVNTLMLQVLLALLPGTLVMMYFFGWGVLFNIVLAIVFAVTLEAIALYLRKRPVITFLGDFSAIVTAWLLALTLPPLMPWWIVFIGVFFAIIIAKHLYGGLGYNPFNPAMVGFAVLIISFPFEMTQWIQPQSPGHQLYGFIDSLKMVLNAAYTPDWDAITMATPLDEVKTGLRSGQHYEQIIKQSPYLQNELQNTWLYSSLAFLLGGLWLLYKKVIDWRIPVALLATLAGMSFMFHLYDSDQYGSTLLHLFSGAAMLGAFFIATDPVSASTTPLGKLFYGASIGFFIYVIRTWGNYPDAVAFSVLIMNMAVPMIDYYTQPRVLGYKSALVPKKESQNSKQ